MLASSAPEPRGYGTADGDVSILMTAVYPSSVRDEFDASIISVGLLLVTFLVGDIFQI